MSLLLDERRRAMLAEMNIRVMAPQPGGVPAAPARVQPAATEPAPVPAPAPKRPAGTAIADGIAAMDWPTLQQAVAGCTACRLCESRRQAVFGAGGPQADWMVVGDAPGADEDLHGEPFVGQPGQLLDNMLRALALERAHDVFVTNVLKCSPPGMRNPEPAELAQCEPFLRRQVALVQPKIILAMGRSAAQSLLQTAEPIGKLRGRVHDYHGVPVVVTYHPAYLLRTLPDKARAWADLCLAASFIRSD